MRTLLVDNYDSYTYNVFHLLAGVSGEEPIVVENDAISWRALSRWDFDAIVLSPGPGHPKRWHDFGVCQDILRYSEVPVLGICLGHQGLGRALDGVVGSAPVAMHGRLSQIRHTGSGLFEDIPQDFSVVRYHSLTITGSLGPEGKVTAWTDDGVVMGIEHLARPLWGVQFHPESVSTEHGQTLVRNFYALAQSRRRSQWPAVKSRPTRKRAVEPAVPVERPETGVELKIRTVAGEPSTEAVFEGLFGEAENAFWLDSADAPTWLARSSYMGTGAGPERCVLSYDVEAGEVRAQRAGGEEAERASIFAVLDREISRLAVESPAGVPANLLGGFVGYLGYECKADCGAVNEHSSDIPDALLMLADRLVAVDHTEGRTHLIAVCHGDPDDCERWLDE
ncbi:MAG TPA: gamma-glutamyl-gamma-aminobutyrate hydrolase family protein, partial [Solirubrobacterales bacterium]|nr:gamma-glutamyl-gamma-aminobutyrate hydrolase family protein [Solirubrobacterales bacterium]